MPPVREPTWAKSIVADAAHVLAITTHLVKAFDTMHLRYRASVKVILLCLLILTV